MYLTVWTHSVPTLRSSDLGRRPSSNITSDDKYRGGAAAPVASSRPARRPVTQGFSRASSCVRARARHFLIQDRPSPVTLFSRFSDHIGAALEIGRAHV